MLIGSGSFFLDVSGFSGDSSRYKAFFSLTNSYHSFIFSSLNILSVNEAEEVVFVIFSSIDNVI